MRKNYHLSSTQLHVITMMIGGCRLYKYPNTIILTNAGFAVRQRTFWSLVNASLIKPVGRIAKKNGYRQQYGLTKISKTYKP